MSEDLMDDWGDRTGWMEPWLRGRLEHFCGKCGSPTVEERRLRADFDEHTGLRRREMRTRCPNWRRFTGHHDSGWDTAVWVGVRPIPPPPPPYTAIAGPLTDNG